MKKYLLCMLLIALFSCPAFADTMEYVEGEVLVVMRAPMSAYSSKETSVTSAFSEAVLSQAETFARNFGLEALSTFPEIANITGKNIVHLRSDNKSTEELLQELSPVPSVESVYPNYIRTPYSERIPNDPSYSEQWGMTAIGMPQVWDSATGSDSIVVAVLDSGIDYNHADINANMTRDSYGNYGRYFKNGVQTGDPMDRTGHGTHVAGIIGAVGNNGIGVTGVNWRVKMLAVNVMADDRASDSDVILGINYVVSEKNKGLNIRVANISFGGWEGVKPDNSPMGNAIKSLSDAGIICVMAAGNSGENLGNPSSAYTNQRVYPACYRFTNTISVGSFRNGYARSGFSNYNANWVDIAAPGGETGGLEVYSTALNNRYEMRRGTSMSAPHVAGAAALLFAAYPSETASQIKTRILSGARNIDVGNFWASGLLDVVGAYNYTGFNVPVTGVSLNKTTMELGIGESETLYPTISPNNATNRNVTWSSSNETVARVSSGGFVVAEGTGNAVITVRTVDGGRTATCSVTVTQAGTIIRPTHVTLDKKSISLPIGGTEVLTATVLPENATNKNVTWYSNNLFVASVSGGVVYAGQTPGPATITVTTVDGGRSTTCEVRVTVPATGVALNKTSITLNVNEDELLTAYVAPHNVSDYNVTWKSNNEAVASVTQGGLVRAHSGGNAIITVTTNDGNFTDTCSVTVSGGGTAVSVTGVTLNKGSTTINIGGTETLTATVTPANASNKNVEWISNNASVATVNAAGTVTGVATGTANITVRTIDGNYTDTCSVAVSSGTGTTVPVTGVTLNKNSTTIRIEGTETLIATVAPGDASNKTVTWSSSNPAVAMVSSGGMIIGVSVGSAIITVTTQDGNRTATCSVTVTDAAVTIPVTGVTLNKNSTTISVGGAETLAATIIPSDATNKNVSWSSSNQAVAMVSSNGVIIGVSVGSATITVTTQDGERTATCSVIVANANTVIPVTGVTLNKQSTTIGIGGTETLTAIISPSNATSKDVIWGSSNQSVATVSGGLVTGVSAGTANITVMTFDGGYTATCSVTVGNGTITPVPVTNVTLNKQNTTIMVGSTEYLIPTIIPDNATNKNVSWSSNNETVAVVAQGGVTGVGIGEATITVTTEDGNRTSTCAVTVTASTLIPVTGLTLDKNIMILTAGENEMLTATITPDNATNKVVIWESSNMSVASVTQEGLVRALSIGIAEITATAEDNNNISAKCAVNVLEHPGGEPQYFSDKIEAIEKARGFNEDNLDILDGNVVIKRSVAEKIANQLIKDSEDLQKQVEGRSIKTYSLPMFEVPVQKGEVVRVRIPVNGSNVLARTASEIMLLKVLSPNSGRMLKYVNTVNGDDGTFTFLLSGSDAPFTGNITSNTEYDFMVFIRDGGLYDLDGEANSFVVDPLAVVNKIFTNDDDDGGGCSIGFGIIALLLMGLSLYMYKKGRG